MSSQLGYFSLMMVELLERTLGAAAFAVAQIHFVVQTHVARGIPQSLLLSYLSESMTVLT